MDNKNKNLRLKPILMKIAKLVFLGLVAFFLGRYFYNNWDSIVELDISINKGVLALAVLLYCIYQYNVAQLWHYITYEDKAAIRYTDAVTAYLYSILGKYIPGKVFMLAARFPAYDKEGVPLRKVTVCFLLENVCTLLGAGFLFLISLFFFPNDVLKDYMAAVVVMVVLFFVCINPAFINIFLRLIGKLTKKRELEIPFSYLVMLKIVVLFILNWVIAGSGFYLLIRAIYPIPGSQLLYVAGVFALSIIIGILSLFAPSGIGVREGIQLLGLSLVIPNEYAAVIIIIARLWTTVSELILIAIGFIADKIRTLSKKSEGKSRESGLK